MIYRTTNSFRFSTISVVCRTRWEESGRDRERGWTRREVIFKSAMICQEQTKKNKRRGNNVR